MQHSEENPVLLIKYQQEAAPEVNAKLYSNLVEIFLMVEIEYQFCTLSHDRDIFWPNVSICFLWQEEHVA